MFLNSVLFLRIFFYFVEIFFLSDSLYFDCFYFLIFYVFVNDLYLFEFVFVVVSDYVLFFYIVNMDNVLDIGVGFVDIVRFKRSTKFSSYLFEYYCVLFFFIFF